MIVLALIIPRISELIISIVNDIYVELVLLLLFILVLQMVYKLELVLHLQNWRRSRRHFLWLSLHGMRQWLPLLLDVAQIVVYSGRVALRRNHFVA